MAIPPKTPQGGPIFLKPLNIQTIVVPIKGTSSLITHKWSEKVKIKMLNDQMGKKSKVRELRNPDEEYWQSMYHFGEEQGKAGVHEEGFRYGFPAVAFKCAMVTAVTSANAMTKVQARQCFFIEADFEDLVEISGKPQGRTDMVRVGMGSADLRFRGEFKEWSAMLRIKYNADVITKESVVHLVELAGFGVGVGEWRSEKDGVNGAFEVVKQVVKSDDIAA